jgi:hypothetical protein
LPVGLRQINPTGKIPVHEDPKSVAYSSPSRSGKRGVARRHERGMGCGGRDSVGA